eukprot:PhM_4_TR11597/c1_g1_i1/m.58171
MAYRVSGDNDFSNHLTAPNTGHQHQHQHSHNQMHPLHVPSSASDGLNVPTSPSSTSENNNNNNNIDLTLRTDVDIMNRQQQPQQQQQQTWDDPDVLARIKNSGGGGGGHDIMGSEADGLSAQGSEFVRLQAKVEAKALEVRAALAYQKPSIAYGVVFLARFVLSLLFLIILTVTLVSRRRAQESFQIHEAVRNVMYMEDELNDVSTRGDVIEYACRKAIQPFFKGIMFGRRLPSSLDDIPTVSFYNSLGMMSPPRLRFLRMKSSCEDERPPEYKYAQPHCYPSFSADDMLTDAMLVTSMSNSSQVVRVLPYEFSNSSVTLRGATGIRYPFDGNVIDIPMVSMGHLLFAEEARNPGATVSDDRLTEIIDDFIAPFRDSNVSVSADIRAIVLEVGVGYVNTPSPMIGGATLLFEFPPTGGVLTTFALSPFTAEVGYDTIDAVVGVLAVVNICFFGAGWLRYHSYKCAGCEIRKKLNRSLFRRRPWYQCERCGHNYDRKPFAVTCPQCDLRLYRADHTCFLFGVLLNMSFIIVCVNIGLAIAQMVAVIKLSEQAQSHVNRYINAIKLVQESNGGTATLPYSNFCSLQEEMNLSVMIGAINLIISFFEPYTFLGKFPAIGKFLRLFSAGASELLSFFLFFMVAFFGVSCALMLMLATATPGFQTLPISVVTTFRILTMDVAFEDLHAEVPELLYVVYLLFIILGVFIGLNVFISIVESSYRAASTDTQIDRATESVYMLFRAILKVLRRVPCYQAHRRQRRALEKKRKNQKEKLAAAGEQPDNGDDDGDSDDDDDIEGEEDESDATEAASRHQAEQLETTRRLVKVILEELGVQTLRQRSRLSRSSRQVSSASLRSSIADNENSAHKQQPPVVIQHGDKTSQ